MCCTDKHASSSMNEVAGSTLFCYCCGNRMCAAAVAVFIIMQSGGQLAPHLEEQLRQQVGSLLRVALTVGE